MSTILETVRDAVGERVNPAVDALDTHVRDARRAITQGQHAVEDCAAGAALQVRRRPLTAIALAGMSGALAGMAFGLIVGWQVRRRWARD